MSTIKKNNTESTSNILETVRDALDGSGQEDNNKNILGEAGLVLLIHRLTKNLHVSVILFHT